MLGQIHRRSRYRKKALFFTLSNKYFFATIPNQNLSWKTKGKIAKSIRKVIQEALDGHHDAGNLICSQNPSNVIKEHAKTRLILEKDENGINSDLICHINEANAP